MMNVPIRLGERARGPPVQQSRSARLAVSDGRKV